MNTTTGLFHGFVNFLPGQNGFRLPKMADRLPSKFLREDIPLMALSASIGAYCSRLFSLPATTTEFQRFWSPAPVILEVIAVLAFILYWRARANSERLEELRRQGVETRLSKIVDLIEVRFPAPAPEDVAAKGLDAARGVGSTMTLNPGDTFSTAIGAGPVLVTVPSGGRVGGGFPKTMQFTLDDKAHTITLPDGGTVEVLATASGHAELTGTAKGTVIPPEERPK